MAKDKTEIKEEQIEVKNEEVSAEKVTYCYLRSKANFNIPIKLNKNTVELAPFAKLKVVKEQLDFDAQFARYLSITNI